MGGANSNKVTIGVGFLTMLVGAVLLLAMVGVLPRANAPGADPAPAWMGWLISLMFVSAGFIAIVRGMVGADDNNGNLPVTAPRALRALNDIIGLGIAGGLAMLFSWVAFGPGPRHFLMGINGLWMPVSGWSLIGRIAFGFGAILAWCITIAMTVMTLRKWRR
ncbi:MAG TPA: hypothetical protein VHU18_06075 [Rhizomicrobium sp.]|jgi:hypothetical protein|nr:hypothetical protein [Rhizomicrobium sp.]